MRKFSLLTIVYFYSTLAFSQGVCDITNNIEKGGFTYDTPAAGCHPFTARIKDNSGGTDVKYIFDYQGEPASQLASLSPTTNLNYTFTNFTQEPVQYVILQYGKKGGKTMYYCNTVTVRPDNKPQFSYNTCNNNNIEIAIPQNPIVNDFDYYKINWGDGNPDERVEPSQLPYRKNKPLTTPRTIKVEGFYNTPSGCPSPSAITIPRLVSNPAGYQMPNHPNIDKVELKKATQATLTIRGSYDTGGYNLFMTQQGSAYPPEPIKKNITPGNTIIDIPDSTKSYCFYLVRGITCGIEQSAEICTNPITDYKALERQNTLAWLNYPTQMTGITNTTTFGRYLTSTTSIWKQQVGGNISIIPASGTTFTDPIDCTKEYCYQIRTRTQGQLYYFAFTGESISPKICIDRKEVHPPAITQTVVSVNNQNEALTNFTDNSNWTLLKSKYRLFRKEGNDFKKVDSTTTIRDLLDKVDASTQSYCYKINYTDECGSTSLLSPEFCTIHLSEDASGNLSWTPFSPFGNVGISRYEVEYFDENTANPLKEADKTATQNTHEPDLDKFEEEARYRIKTTAGGKDSYSNIYSIPIKTNIFIPEAFSPDGDALNPELQIFGTLKRITEFSFHIFNRWGNPVFSSTDPKSYWDGTFQGKESPIDTYSYALYAKLKDGQEIRKTGKIVLLR